MYKEKMLIIGRCYFIKNEYYDEHGCLQVREYLCIDVTAPRSISVTNPAVSVLGPDSSKSEKVHSISMAMPCGLAMVYSQT